MKRAAAIGMLLIAACVNSNAQALTNGNFGAQPSTGKSAAAKSAERVAPSPKVKSYPFHGELDSAPADGSAIRLRGKTRIREILVTSETRIMRGESGASLKEAIGGERVTGTVFRNEQGREVARTVRLGGKAAK